MSEELRVEELVAQEIMTPHVLMLPPTATLKDIIEMMSERRVSAVVSRVEGEPFRVISHSHLIDFFHSHEGAIDTSQIPLTALPFREVALVRPHTTVDEVIRLMVARNCKRVVVGENDTPIGVISTRDILTWNDHYFKQARPLIFLVIANGSGIIVGQHIFYDNLDAELNAALVELIGGALSAISHIIDEVMDGAGYMRQLEKENITILLEPRPHFTCALFCDTNSIHLRRDLHDATAYFHEKHKRLIEEVAAGCAPCQTIDVSDVADYFIRD
jgi:CBS domain-containing protein